MQEHITHIEAEEQERWLPVVGYEGFYSVSNLGRIRRDANRSNTKAGNILKARATPLGYLHITLSHNGIASDRYIHRLVLEAFSGVPAEKMEACHIDGSRNNNRASNLRWGTPKENCGDRDRHGNTARGSTQGRSILTEEKVREIRRMSKAGERQITISRYFGVHKSTIQSIRDGRSWKHIT